jgi:hypothetical protein
MANSDHLKALLRAYAKGDQAQFTSVAMQIAANEAAAGHGKLAEELRKLIDDAKVRVPQPGPSPIPLAKPRGEVADLLTVSYPSVRLADMVLAPTTRKTSTGCSKSTRPSVKSAATAWPPARNSCCSARPAPARR